MLVAISKIKINPGRRDLVPKRVEELAESIAASSLVCPITLNQDYTLIAGLHRLEAVKLLGWTEIECYVIELNNLQAQIAEIDENIIRSNLNDIELGRILLRRKEAYEMLHPSAKQGGDRKSEEIKTRGARFDKPFTVDTSEKTGMSRRSVEEKIQVVQNLTPEVQEIVKNKNIGFKKALQLSHLPSDQQKDAVTMLLNGEIQSVDEYMAVRSGSKPDTLPFHVHPSTKQLGDTKREEIKTRGARLDNSFAADTSDEKNEMPRSSMEEKMQIVQNLAPEPDTPFRTGERQFSSFAEGVADLKDTTKDFRCTPDGFLAEITSFVRKFQQEIEWYTNPYYEEVFPALSPEQVAYLRQQMDAVSTAAKKLYKIVERKSKNELPKKTLSSEAGQARPAEYI